MRARVLIDVIFRSQRLFFVNYLSFPLFGICAFNLFLICLPLLPVMDKNRVDE